MGIAEATRDLFSAYPLSPGAFDELRADVDAVRPGWQTFVDSLSTLGPGELLVRWEQAQRMIRENGVTYNVYADPQGTARPWALDPIPLLISAAEWEAIEAAVEQRAVLVDAILADLYSDQKLLARRLLPPELVFAHSGFLRPCHGLEVPEQRYLHLYAADLGRWPDGSWCVVKDRTQAPSGAGYALENRIVLARSLPEAFRDCQAQRLAPFFRTLRQTLAAMAPRHRENPRIVLLTPGPFNESYFEHAYLARYLGYTLVQGADLTVRDDAVWLKTLGGLQPVDVILRRMDDAFCDPLELRGDSFLGVPGLVQAAREGNVAIANALGTGVVQTPALMPFLPNLCRTLLDEDLKLPSVPTFWCGDEQARQHVEANLSRMVIKPSYPVPGVDPVFGEKLTRPQRERLLARMRQRPEQFTAQEQVELSTVPVLVGQRLEPRHVMLRSYAVAYGEGYVVMPGGMARVSPLLESLVVTLQQGGGSKDTWVQSSTPLEVTSVLRPPDHPVELTRGSGDLSSRLADNLYWLGRYVERVEGKVRLLRSILVRMIDYNKLGPEVPPLMRALVGEFDSKLLWNDLRVELLAFTFDEERPYNLCQTLRSVEKVGASVRDRLSNDTWRILSSLYEDFAKPAPSRRMQLTDVLVLANRLVLNLAAFSGLAFENSTRGQGLRFLEIGKRLERAIYTLNLLQTTLVSPASRELPVLEALLEVGDSSMTYRQRYLTSLQAVPVVDLLLCDESNPRSVAFQLAGLAKQVARLPQANANRAQLPLEQRITLGSLTSLRLADVEDLCKIGPDGARAGLRDMCTRLIEHLPSLSDIISQSYLRHAPVPRHLASLEDGIQQPEEAPEGTGDAV